VAKKKLSKEKKMKREREYWTFCYEQLGRNRGEMWKWSKKKFIRKSSWKRKRKGGSRLKVQKMVEFMKI